MRRPGRDRGVLLALAIVAVILAFALGLAFGNAAAEQACVTGPKDPSGIFVNLDDTRNAEAIDHVRDAVAHGQPRVLHWDPAGNEERRKLSLRGIKTAPGKDRDEYPPAASEEGGAGADVRLISSSDNRSAGTRMNAQMSAYCPGTRFLLEP